jgi:ATP-binding cassette subfamily F protein 3
LNADAEALGRKPKSSQNNAAKSSGGSNTGKNGASKDRTGNAGSSKTGKTKRRFPYRKVSDIENEIALEEERLVKLEAALAEPDIYRDAQRLKDAMNAFEDAKAKMAALYEHWEESVELNSDRK